MITSSAPPCWARMKKGLPFPVQFYLWRRRYEQGGAVTARREVSRRPQRYTELHD